MDSTRLFQCVRDKSDLEKMAVSIIVRYMWVNRISRASLSFDILMNCSMQASTKLRARMINCALFWVLEC